MTIQSIYDHYQIPPHLQLHMLRVAAVAQTICDHRTGKPIDRENIITAALLHDMGNIVREGFTTKLRGLYNEDTRKTIETIHQHARDTYGTHDHQANIAIARELKVPDTVITLIDGISFKYIAKRRDNRNQIILHHGDLRVSPYAVVSMKQRFEERAQRNPHHPHVTNGGWDEEYNNAQLEQNELQQHISLALSSITEELITPLLEPLRSREIPTT